MNQTPYFPLQINKPLHIICKILRNVVSSAAEKDIATAFLAAIAAVPILTTLVELDHPQPPTPIQVNTSTCTGFANDKIKQKRKKSIDMEFYWLQDRVEWVQFLVYCQPGNDNLVDYLTKHHSPSHHKIMRLFFLYMNREQLANLFKTRLMRGCHNSTLNPGSSIYIYDPSITCVHPSISSLVL